MAGFVMPEIIKRNAGGQNVGINHQGLSNQMIIEKKSF
jgi:hypothetical protein